MISSLLVLSLYSTRRGLKFVILMRTLMNSTKVKWRTSFVYALGIFLGLVALSKGITLAYLVVLGILLIPLSIFFLPQLLSILFLLLILTIPKYLPLLLLLLVVFCMVKLALIWSVPTKLVQLLKRARRSLTGSSSSTTLRKRRDRAKNITQRYYG